MEPGPDNNEVFWRLARFFDRYFIKQDAVSGEVTRCQTTTVHNGRLLKANPP